MAFRFQFSYTFEDLVILNRVVRKTYRRRSYAIIRAVGFLLGGVSLLMSLLLLVLGELSSGLLGLIPGLVILALSIWYDQINAWVTRRLLMKGMGELTVCLEEAGVREKSLKGEGFYPYASFIGAFHCRGRYLLFLDKKHGMILPESALTAGDPAALGGWLAERLGKEIIEVR